MPGPTLDRRRLLALGAAALASPAIARADQLTGNPADVTDPAADPRHNISSFTSKRWQDYFENLKNGVILADTTSRAVHFWNEDASVYLLYPSSVPTAPELTRKGMTRVVEKVVGSTWHPTPSMRVRMPWLPPVVGPGPDNPLGPFALYLSWQYYRVHGTQDTRKIGRASSDGCIGLYNEDITTLFKYAKVGTQVRII